jgi:Flp pilus assembly protein TadB
MTSGAASLALGVFFGLTGLFVVRAGSGFKDAEFLRASTLSPAEWRRLQARRKSGYERWLRPALQLWGTRLHLRPIRIDRLLLVQAGLDPDRFDGLQLRTLKIAGAITGCLTAFALGLLSATLLFLAPLLIWLGHLSPTWVLSARRRPQQAQISDELPDFAGVLHAFITAGVPFERALHLIAQGRPAGPLTDELRLALTRFGLGISIEQALEEMAQRIGADDATVFIGALTRGKRLGVGGEQILRDQELQLRMNQRNRAAAEASRVGTKLLGVVAGIYLPEFMILIMVPLFLGVIRRAFG